MSRSSMVDSARRISAIVADTAPMDQRAEAVLGELAKIVAYDAAQIAVWDPMTSTHHTVASRGYTEEMRAALNGPRYRTDRVWGVLEQRAEPVFWKDCPFDRRESAFYVQAVEAHGFREGATMLLRAIDGVYLGMLLLNLEVAAPPADEVREVLGIVGAGMSPLVDRLAPARQFVSMYSPQLPAAALDRVHGWVPLTPEDLPPPALLEAIAEVLSRTDRPTRFRWCDRDGDRRGRQSRAQPLTVELFPFSGSTCRAVVSWRQEPLPYGLTRRELDVLAVLVTGASNAAIAQALSTSVRTITTHVEHILAKLSVTTRTAAALLADREGLLSFDERYAI
ncbi:response regulator transcription factor [Rhodococcus sp. ABRD24]|uniref:helix-turn-helix transcriptional regulator n=1 Tax=Rhodococcus sp. ABRD24 TaxID=2507582 RepID=UPI001039DFB2|nr:LuxR C-terminal-related transcriptional regulator [Rhodococcus sp. ABRD24]QBJ96754.1 response regulator transcription factor [Rhodococcus sp. ABRD24]